MATNVLTLKYPIFLSLFSVGRIAKHFAFNFTTKHPLYVTIFIANHPLTYYLTKKVTGYKCNTQIP